MKASTIYTLRHYITVNSLKTSANGQRKHKFLEPHPTLALALNNTVKRSICGYFMAPDIAVDFFILTPF